MIHDAIIVGAGAAGCILAARLSEDPGTHVLLIEAGQDTPPGAVPADIRDPYPVSYSNPAYFWNGWTAKARQGGREAAFPQARVMGGGSSVMGMWALRGQPADYDRWAAAGATGWGWDDVLPAFRRLESDWDFDGALHGDSGPIPILRHRAETWPAFAQALAQAAQALGLPLRADINGEFGDGVYPVPVTNDSRERTSAASGYLTAEVRRRPNLKVLCNATVERVLFDSRSARGVAIRDSSGGRTLTGREIYLSAGAIGSPALLLRSGIGEAEALRRLGIEPVADLRGVGRGLQNHCIVNLAAWIAPSARQPDAMRTYALACARASSKHPLGRPGDLHLQFITRTSPNAHGDRLGIVGAALYAPLSRGSVTLRTPDPATPPDVAFNFLDHPADAERLAAVVGMALSLLDAPAVRALRGEVIAVTPSSLVRRLNRPDPRTRLAARLLAALLDAPAPLRRLVMQRAGTPLPHQDDLAANSAKQLLDYVQPVFHPTGTCAIGAADDPLAVLDPMCRVRGVEHLSVVDASVMPHIPTGNTCLPTMMVAEHAASLRRRRL